MDKKLTERQQKILDVVVREYVNTAEPVSSQELLKKHDFGVSPATIRIEMQKLTDKGFLLQPHTSAGRIPTDRGYRFFVNNLVNKEEPSVAKAMEGKKTSGELSLTDWGGEEKEDVFRFVQNLTRKLAEETRALALNYFEDEDLFWREGWEEVLKEPEFEERDNIIDFTQFLRNFEEHIEDLKNNPGINVYIGKENSLPKSQNFTIISSRYVLPGGGRGIISILGPKRMDYDKNVDILNSLNKNAGRKKTGKKGILRR